MFSSPQSKPRKGLSYSIVSFACLIVLLLGISITIAVYKPMNRKELLEKAVQKAKDSLEKIVFRPVEKK